MSSYTGTTGEGSTNPSSASCQATTLSTNQPPNQGKNTNTIKIEKTEQNGKKRKRGKRDRLPSDNPTSADNKPRRERANFNAAQIDALERLFHGQKYPDGDLRAKIASRLDMNEERVQIWFQNRRAKHKRSQREGGSVPPSSELSPGLAFELQPPSSVDEYIPPQLDEEMLGPGPCTVQVLPHQVTAAAPQTTDQIPGVLQKCTVNGGPDLTFSRDNYFGPPPDQSNGTNHSKSEWSMAGNRDLEMFSPLSVDGMLCNANNIHSQSVGKFTGFEPVEFPPSTVNHHMNETDVTGPPVNTMCHVDEAPWNTASHQRSVVQINDSKTNCLPVQQHSFTKTVHHQNPSQHHSGETPCRKDNKCLTCREKPPPNQVCTALPPGERNELDEALYRCAVGSIFGIRSLTPRPTAAAEPPTRTANPSAADTPSIVAISVDATKLAQSKAAKNSKESSLSSQRRMALARKQRQLEAGYLSSSSDSSTSDGEGETLRRRRRKCARTGDTNGLPPNRVCTAVPLLDRTLPLPCLTKDLDLDSYLEGDKTLGHGGVVVPPGGFPSCMPSPLSPDRLSSPEPRSSPSEPPEFSSSSSSSDLSDFEYIPPPPATCRSLPSTVTTAFTPGYEFIGRNKVDGDSNLQRGREGKATYMAANKHIVSHSLPKQDGVSTVRCRVGPPQADCIQPPSCSYATGGRAAALERTNFNRHDGILSSIPPPFAMQLNPATLSLSDNSSKQVHTGNGASSSACDEKRKKHNCEILTESRIVGEMCSNSPDSPWSDSGLHSPYFNHTSPQTDQLYPRLPSDSRPPPFHPHTSHPRHEAPYESQQTLAVPNGISPHVNHNDVGFTGMTSKHLQFQRHNQPINSQPINSQPINSQPIACHYPPMTQHFGTPMYNPPISVHQTTYGGGNGGESYRERLPMRSLERAPVAMGVPMTQNGAQFTQNGYGLNCRSRTHSYPNFHPTHPPPNRSCISATDSRRYNPQQKPVGVMGHNQPLPFSRMFSDTCNY
ncbi:uncharacterized protein LOC117307424 [Asterias rubens]|uniref:uncharacterized protein LOC117307424 n=1 Tax=Asterias rubens TaxID=7604 RepID=UPI0014553727|nr:uncharacterized protein LOC117307424 [Asterias rubens]